MNNRAGYLCRAVFPLVWCLSVEIIQLINVISLWLEIITDIILRQFYIPLSVCPCLVLSLYITLYYYCYQSQGSSQTESSEKHGALSCIPLHHKLGSAKNREASCAVLISTWKHRTEAALAVCRCSHKGRGTLRNSVWADFLLNQASA